jgi:hypothetical protein
MKFNCSRPIDLYMARVDRLLEWHPWFAWRPVRVDSGDCRWLEWVERRGNFWAACGESWWTWKYRANGQSLK